MNPVESPVARALVALELVQAQPGITAERLGERLGVSERAARRYVAILREAGIPIESTRGPYGGYRIGRGLRPPPMMFTATEALGLVMAVLDSRPDVTTDGALAKLIRVLPEPVAAQAEAVRRSAATAGPPAARPDPLTTAALVQACSEHRRVRMRYRPGSGPQFETDADPWSVVVRFGRWYLLCFSHRAGARRAYRIDRIAAIAAIDASSVRFEPPPDLDPMAALEEQLAVGWEYDVEVLVEAPYAAALPRVPRSLGRLSPAGESRCRLVATTGDPHWYAQQLAAFPVPIRVLGGPELRAAVAAIGQRLSQAAAVEIPHQ
ncbi:WYL domain-containing protein [Dactylosporangium vinaceum]|uniref:Helix-turn-helix transcriptional regulator n=1 Tax=Dactylosporangium vinaceum TaxID=53362 RepID=A0ABV5MMG2_9ACTN|nr:WYL domain-containing protein [Dactylosporangium vinaceum]UAC02047.1 WYL domain-containing protein [Dactylosporangium vinaceum]